jgi:hypothetical protein
LDSWIKDFTFSKWIRNFKVLSATEAVTMNTKSRVLKFNLGMDPVHLTPEGYAQLASVVAEYAGEDFTRAKRKSVDPGSSVKISNLSEKRQNRGFRGGGRFFRGY